MLYGDSQQQIFRNLKETLSIEEIQNYLQLPSKELLKNYRLPKSIAACASYLTKDNSLVNRCVKPGSDKPKIKKFKSWTEELDWLMAEIQTRNYTDVAILLPFNDKKAARTSNLHRNVESVREYLDQKNFRHEFKMTIDKNSYMNLDFDSELPKIMTYHSSKGLQFETVFIPFCDIPHSPWLAKNYLNPLYVALTRPYKNLYISYSEKVTPFFQNLPSTVFA